MIFAITNQICSDEKKVLILKEDGTTECKDCPQNCEICYRTIGDNLECSYCADGYFKDLNGVCKPCYKNCFSCLGPKLNQCQ